MTRSFRDVAYASILALSPLPGGIMANGFNVVPVRIQDKRAVVVWMVVGTGARSTIVPPACSEGSLVESIDQGTARGAKGDVHRRIVRLACHDPEVRLGRHTESG